MNDDSFEHITEERHRNMLSEVQERYWALSGRYLTMPLGQLHIDIGTLLHIIDGMKPKENKREKYREVLEDIAHQLMSGFITWEEADEKCYNLGKGWMNIIDVEAELRSIVRDDAVEKAPVWVKWQADVIDNLLKGIDDLQERVKLLETPPVKRSGMFDENENDRNQYDGKNGNGYQPLPPKKK